MGDGETGDIIEPSEDLVHEDFSGCGSEFLFADSLVEIEGKVIHNDIQVLFIVLICEEVVSHF